MISKHLYFLMKWDFKQNYFSVKRDFVNWRYWHIKRIGDIKMMMRKSKWHLQIRFQIKKYPKMGRKYYELWEGNKEWPLYIICFIKTMKRNCFIGKNGINYLILYMKIWFCFFISTMNDLEIILITEYWLQYHLKIIYMKADLNDLGRNQKTV